MLGFSQGDEVLLMIARLIVNVIKQMARKDNFVGHLGGDDFVFIVKKENIKQVCDKILANFEVVKKMFIKRQDLEAGGYTEKDRQGRKKHYNLLSISISVIPGSAEPIQPLWRSLCSCPSKKTLFKREEREQLHY